MVLLHLLTNKGFFDDFICNSEFLSMAFFQVRNPIRKKLSRNLSFEIDRNQNKQAVNLPQEQVRLLKNFEVYLDQNRNLYSIYLTGKNKRVLL